jgi:hypothetical protein
LESGWEDVVLVYVLDERLNTGFLDEFFLAVSPLDLRDVAGNAGDE